MAREHRLPPSAASLSASLRDLGYSLETAIADLIDNSISAGADTINIVCDVENPEPVVMVHDNGDGMTENELLSAMRHGTGSPRKERASHDLGRFGLGLKTASFSQCRSLTVASVQNGVRCGAEWNLDTVDENDDWILIILDEGDIEQLPYVDFLDGQGTVVIWRQLDRLFEDEVGHRLHEMVHEKLDVVEKHLSLVFHRFLAGEIKGVPKLSITINGHVIEAFDPFCRKNSATQALPEEIVRIGDAVVRMQPYVLPHHSRLSAVEYDYYQSRSDFISNQGAYVYRNGRLMAWGDWFRLVPKGEATKLARVQIDFPNCLDEAWTIDIKKSRAKPPRAVRERLRQIISQITSRSVTVHRARGQKLFQETKEPIWERYSDQARIKYELNRTHPLVQGLRGQLDKDGAQLLDLFLASCSAALPVEMIYSDYSTSPRDVSQKSTQHDTYDTLSALRRAIWGEEVGNASAFREIVRSTGLFNDDNTNVVEEFIKEEFA